jgi:hypothetical protein
VSSESAQAEVLATLAQEARQAAALVKGGDVARNEPLEIDAFPMLPTGSKECRFCAFRRLCGRG